MRIFVSALVAAFGIALFAVAALVWDRRAEIVRRSIRGSAGASAGRPGAGGEQAVGGSAGGSGVGAGVDVQVRAQPASGRRFLPHGIVVGALIVGMIMLIGACAGLLNF
jgi:hypothetical protein